MNFDHDHGKCVLKVCPRCGWDPMLNMGKGGVRQNTHVPLAEHLYSCSICDECWATYEADMTPLERAEYSPHVIEEAAELW